MFDITIIYAKGDPIGLLNPGTTAGRAWLSAHVKGVRVNRCAVATPEQLLVIIEAVKAAGLSLIWRDQ